MSELAWPDWEKLREASGGFPPEAFQFVRDGLGRVTAVVMPNGSRIRYGYNAAGDLETVTDELGAVTRYRYDARHNLVQIIDPSGRTPTRQEYDEKGKLVALVYPDGTRVAMDSDTAARVEVVRDRQRQTFSATVESPRPANEE